MKRSKNQVPDAPAELLEEHVEAPRPARSERDERLAAVASVAGEFEAFRPAREVLSLVRAVPTCLVQYDHATRCGGHPIERVVVVHGPSGHGKAQPMDAPVLTPTGWRAMGEMRVGDDVVGIDGKPTKVTGVYPQGELEVFAVVFSDRSVVECCEEHLWATRTPAIGLAAAFVPKTLAEVRDTIDEDHEVPRVNIVGVGVPLRAKRIVSVKYSRRAPCICIAVAHPSRLYVTSGFTATHNTTYTLALIRSFLARGHFAKMVDAERTTPMTFAETIIGRELACSPGFFASRPPTYEQAVKEVRDFVMTVKRVRDEGRVADDVSAIVVVDSMRKLVPANILAKILADPDKPRRGKDGGVDGMGGRAAQIKAAMNAAWLDELVPLLEETRCAFVAIARETDDMEAEAWEEDFKVGGGKALTYDSSLLLRVTRAGYVQKGKSGDENADKNRPVYGERHRVTIRKTKLSAQETKRTLCHFHTSNGVLEGVPEGLDRARDVLELAERFGVVRRAGSWYSWERKRWQGEDAAVQKLSGDPETLDAIEAEMRINFAEQSPIEVECADG